MKLQRRKQFGGLLLDLAGLAGVVSVVYGVALIHSPTAYIVAGLAATAAAILRAKRWDS